MKNIVIYARYSSDRQTEQSIEGQLRVCYEYANRCGFNIVHEYIDRAISGTTDNRPSFQQMIDDASKKEFEYILVYKLDRFARNKFDSVFYKHKLELLGVKVLSATEAISDTPEGRLVEGILEMMAEMYSQDLSQKVKRGMRESIIKGQYIGGIPLYGYKVNEHKKIIIDEEKAPAIRYLFEEYAKGSTLKEIIDTLNQRGYRSNKGKAISYASFQDNLHNKKYIGLFEYEGEVYKNYYPALIDNETFEKVQQRLVRNKKLGAKQKAHVEYILTGKVFCGYCGSNLNGISGTSHTKEKYHYYVCVNNYKKHNCKKRNEKKEFLEWYLTQQILSYFEYEEVLNHVVSLVLDEYKKNINHQTIERLNHQLQNIETEMNVIYKKFVNTDSEEMMKKLNHQMKDLEGERSTLSAELAKLKLAIGIKHTEEDIKNYIRLFLKGDELNIDYQKKLIDVFINSIYLYDDRCLVYFNLFDQVKQVSFFEMLEDLDELESIDFEDVHSGSNTSVSGPPNEKTPMREFFHLSS